MEYRYTALKGTRVSDKTISLACAVLTVSNSRSAGNDTSGNLLSQSLAHAGHTCVRRDIVKNDIYQIRRVLSDWIADPAVQVILANGGTGLSHRHTTPLAVTPLLDQTIEGFAELFRLVSHAEIGSSAVQSRAIAGVANNTLIFCMPGSNHACQTAWNDILREQLDSSHQPCNFATLFRPSAPAE